MQDIEQFRRMLNDLLSPLQWRVLGIRANTRAEDEDAARIVGEILALSDEEARKYLEDFEKLIEEVVEEMADERERRPLPPQGQ